MASCNDSDTNSELYDPVCAMFVFVFSLQQEGEYGGVPKAVLSSSLSIFLTSTWEAIPWSKYEETVTWKETQQ